MTSTSHSTSFEGRSSVQDDRPERANARVLLLVKQMGPVGQQLLQEFPGFSWKSSDLQRVLERYKHFRDEAERLMTGAIPPDHLLVIDRHKIGAAFILAILDVEPLKGPYPSPSQLEGERLINAILAFRTAVRIVGAFARLEARETSDSKMELKWKVPVKFPVTNDGIHYKHHAYRALFHGHRQRKLNLPILAHWLFVIEQYHDLACA